jgi:hypothetical protein
MRLDSLRLGRGAAGACLAFVAALAIGPMALKAEAKPIRAAVALEIFAVIDHQATVTYYFGGQVAAEGLAFGCMEGRRVMLFHVGPGGSRQQVAATDTHIFGRFLAPLERRIAVIPGHYYAVVKPRIRKTRRGKLRCLTARSPSVLVQVPGGLGTAVVLRG